MTLKGNRESQFNCLKSKSHTFENIVCINYNTFTQESESARGLEFQLSRRNRRTSQHHIDTVKVGQSMINFFNIVLMTAINFFNGALVTM